jgi:hypothetical protein
LFVKTGFAQYNFDLTQNENQLFDVYYENVCKDSSSSLLLNFKLGKFRKVKVTNFHYNEHITRFNINGKDVTEKGNSFFANNNFRINLYFTYKEEHLNKPYTLCSFDIQYMNGKKYTIKIFQNNFYKYVKSEDFESQREIVLKRSNNCLDSLCLAIPNGAKSEFINLVDKRNQEIVFSKIVLNKRDSYINFDNLQFGSYTLVYFIGWLKYETDILYTE